MKKFLLLALAFPLLTATGCKATNKSVLSAPVTVAAASSNLYANMEVGEQIQGRSEGTYLFGFLKLKGPKTFADGVKFHTGFTYGALKSAAAYDALQESGAEVIVNPQYILNVQRNVIFKTVVVDVTGYKGTIKNFTDTGPKE